MQPIYTRRHLLSILIFFLFYVIHLSELHVQYMFYIYYNLGTVGKVGRWQRGRIWGYSTWLVFILSSIFLYNLRTIHYWLLRIISYYYNCWRSFLLLWGQYCLYCICLYNSYWGRFTVIFNLHSLQLFTCKVSLRQVFIRVYRLEIQSVMLSFLTQLCELLPLSPFALVQLIPHPCMNKYIVYMYTVCKGGGYVVLGLRQINTCRKVPLQVNFFWWLYFGLPFMSLIFLRLQ
jgi:hypothetical protein